MLDTNLPKLPAQAHPAPEKHTSSHNLPPASPPTRPDPISPQSEYTEWRRNQLSSQVHPYRISAQNETDVERGCMGGRMAFRRTTTWETLDDDLKYHEDMRTVRSHAMTILVCLLLIIPQNTKLTEQKIFLSGPVFFVNLIGAIWSIIAPLFICITHPCHLIGCARRTKSLRDRIVSALEPFISFNLFFIYASPRSRSDSAYSISSLTGVLLLSPLLSIGITAAAWTAAFFWLFAVMVGDPKGTEEQEKRNSSLHEEKDEDGRDTVMWCRRVWRDWLLRSMG
jgi:hypothetical protein